MLQMVLYPLTSFHLYFPGGFSANACWVCWGVLVFCIYDFKMNYVQILSFQLYTSTGQD